MNAYLLVPSNAKHADQNWFFNYLCGMQNAIKKIQTELQGLYSDNEIRGFSNLILEKLTGFSRAEIIINKNTFFSIQQQGSVESFIEKLKVFFPIQYILGETEFYGLKFEMNNSVLIPRPETEELVDWICNEHHRGDKLDILDIGTGSGCIAISLKHEFPHSEVDAFDISEKALETARRNALNLHLDVQFSEFDILNAPETDKKWDIIASNPPYVLDSEKEQMLPNVLEHEPHLALFVPDNDPLVFYREIAGFAKKHLRPGGKLYFEINREMGNACRE
ncbi:MAG TPA: peptide chain release factor N(5)-glutamine methyltransferase, partial [Paludibacter sp.]|nr:peptide chain release factor N(5)-glutamine methyltransferase [Paludibacter sp.]